MKMVGANPPVPVFLEAMEEEIQREAAVRGTAAGARDNSDKAEDSGSSKGKKKPNNNGGGGSMGSFGAGKPPKGGQSPKKSGPPSGGAAGGGKKGAGKPADPKKCHHCKDEHYIVNCDSFKNLSLSEKSAKVKEYGLCYKCLRPGHIGADCTFAKPCTAVDDGGKCGKTTHHRLLHRPAK